MTGKYEGTHVGDHQRQDQPVASSPLADDEYGGHRRVNDSGKYRPHPDHGTDLLIFSHEWNNNHVSPLDRYTRFLGRCATLSSTDPQAPPLRQDRQHRYLLAADSVSRRYRSSGKQRWSQPFFG